MSLRLLAVIAVLPLLSACEAHYDTLGIFDNQCEVFRGSIDHNLSAGVGEITVTSLSNGAICRGRSKVTAYNGLKCKGQKGEAPLICSDGRTVKTFWTATSCVTGEGYGQSSEGETFTFVFGTKGKETDDLVNRLQSKVQGCDIRNLI